MKWIKCARAADYGLIEHVGILDCSLAPELLEIVQLRQLLLLPQLQVRVAAHPPQQLLCVLPLAQLDNQCVHQSGRQHHSQQGQQSTDDREKNPFFSLSSVLFMLWLLVTSRRRQRAIADWLASWLDG